MTYDEMMEVDSRRVFFIGAWMFYLVHHEIDGWNFAPVVYWGA